MKTANKCPKKSCTACGGAITVNQAFSTQEWKCGTISNWTSACGWIWSQSDLCRERCKVTKLKKQVERLKDKLQTAENLAFNLDCTLIKAREMIHELETKNSEVRR